MIGAAGVLLLVAVLVAAARSRKPVSATVCGAGFVDRVRARDPARRPQPATGRRPSPTRSSATAGPPSPRCSSPAAASIAVLISYGERWREDHVGEYYALLAAAGAGMAFFVQASNLMTLFLGLEWFSIALYVMCAIDIDLVGSLEAGLKYLIIGSVGSATLLFGSALVYGATGELGFDKIGAAGKAARRAARRSASRW